MVGELFYAILPPLALNDKYFIYGNFEAIFFDKFVYF